MSVAPSEVTALRLCPGSVAGQGSGVTVFAETLEFDALLAAVIAPDVPSQPGVVCPAYADVRQVVIASTAAGALAVHLPVDACGHYQRAVLDAVNAIRLHHLQQ